MVLVDPMEVRDASRGPGIALAGLLIAGIVAFFLCPIPTLYSSWTALLRAAVTNVMFVSLAGVIAVAVLCALISRARRFESDRLIVEISFAALWIAPLILFTRENSLWTIAIAVPFAVVTTRLLLPPHYPTVTSSDRSILFSYEPDNLPLSGFNAKPYISFGAALCVQVGAFGVLAGYTTSGALLVGTGFCIWTRSFANYAASTEDYPRLPSRQSTRLVGAALAILFMAVGLFPYLRIAGGFGGRAHSGGRRPGQSSQRSGYPSRVRSQPAVEIAGTTSDGNSGIVLWPVKQTYTKLVAPIPTRGSETFSGRRSNPLLIPFNGVYWFFKAPDLQPPRNSREAHASPETVNIRSTDRRPLSIEAHEHLGTLIDLDCCSKIQIAIRNADRYPETVSLELVLINTSLPNQPSESLGKAVVKSTQPWKIYEEQKPTSETLNFTIPTRPSLRRFDEMKIVFRLDRVRADAGAKIAIDHFVLIPRAL